MSVAVEILEVVARFTFWLLVDVVAVVTGEAVLWALTFGRRKPRWDLYTSERPRGFVVLSELSFWVGIASWVLLIVSARHLLPAE